MSTLADLSGKVQDRLEEPRGAGLFWNKAYEVNPALVEAMYEATLIVGEPEVRTTAPYTIAATQTLQPMPAGALAVVRMEGAGGLPVKKNFVWDLDMDNPLWESTPPAADIQGWFPFGLTQFGVFPQVTAPIQVILTVVAFPIPSTDVYPYTATDPSLFQEEYNDAFCDYAAAVLALKEGGQELANAVNVYQSFLSRMEDLSTFAIRKGSLRFSKTMGLPVGVSPVEKK